MSTVSLTAAMNSDWSRFLFPTFWLAYSLYEVPSSLSRELVLPIVPPDPSLGDSGFKKQQLIFKKDACKRVTKYAF